MVKPVASLAAARAHGIRKVLAIHSALSESQSATLFQDTAVRTISFQSVTAPLLMQENPDCVLAPLVIGALDIQDIAERLVAFGYRGLLLAVAPELPNPDLIRTEMRALFPQIAFDLIENLET